MRRGKVPIEPIKKRSSRQVTFCKRRCGLFKKANELAVLCDAQVAVITFASSGKMYDYSSPGSSVKTILERYEKTVTGETRSDHSHNLHISDGVKDQYNISLQNLECRDLRMLDELEHQLCMRLGYVRAIMNREIMGQIKELKLEECSLVEESKSLHERVHQLVKAVDNYGGEEGAVLPHKKCLQPWASFLQP